MIGKIAKINITDKPNVGDGFEIRYGGIRIIKIKFRESRFGKGDVVIPKQPDPNGALSSQRLRDVINADYNSLRDIGILISDEGLGIIMVSLNPDWGFELISENPTGLVEIEQQLNPFNITNTQFKTGVEDCDHVKLEVTTDVQTAKITKPVDQLVTENPFTIRIERATPRNYNNDSVVYANSQTELELKSIDDVYAYKYLATPVKLMSSAVKIEVTNTPAGSTAKVLIDENGLDLQYSLDDENSWDSQSTFSNIITGSHTIYVKDQFGCHISKSFETSPFKPSDPILYVSESLSNRFVKDIEFGTCSNYKNEKNALSCQEDVPKAFKEVQTFQNCDNLFVQVKSNYQDNKVVIEKINGESTSYNMFKLTNNIGVRDSRTAKVIYVESLQKDGIYFESGDLFDFVDGSVIGDYTLNGGLPSWGVKGNFLTTTNASSGDIWREIKNVVYIEEVNAFVLVVDFLYVHYNEEIKVGSVYNREEYEIYETSFPLSSKSGRYQIEIKANDFIYGETKFISEEIEVKNVWENTTFIEYWNKSNTDIYYASGIKNTIRIPVEVVEASFDDEFENQKGDATVRLINEKQYQLNEFKFSPVTTGMMRKLVIALSHTHVFINGMRYVKAGIDVELVNKNSNVYNVIAKMILADDSLDLSKFQGSAQNYEVPNLISVVNGSYLEH